MGVVGPGEQGAPAAFDVDHEVAVDEDDEGSCLATGPVTALLVGQVRWAGGPGERRAIGVGRVARRHHERPWSLVGPVPAGTALRLRPRLVGVGRRRARRRHGVGTQPVDGSGDPELCGSEAGDEVATSAPTGLLECRQHLIDRREAAGNPLGDDGAAGEDAVAVQQCLTGRVGAAGWVGVAARQE